MTRACVTRDDYSFKSSSEQIQEYTDLRNVVEDAKQKNKTASNERKNNKDMQDELISKQNMSIEKSRLEGLKKTTLEFKQHIESAIKSACDNHSMERIENSNLAIKAMGLPFELRFSDEKETQKEGSRHFVNKSDGAQIGLGKRGGSLSSGQGAVCYAALLAAEFQSTKVLLPLFLDDAMDKADHEQILDVSLGLNQWAQQLGCQVWICSNSVREVDHDEINKSTCTTHIVGLTADYIGNDGTLVKKIRKQEDFEVKIQ